MHSPKSDSIDLDRLGLTAGKTYKWDYFQCKRQPCGSQLRIKTSIYFQQPQSLYGIGKAGSASEPFTLEIWKRAGGNGSCASTGTQADSVKAANLTYQLIDAAGKSVKELANGQTYYGGIRISEPEIILDTAKITPDSSLVPGATYSVVAFEAARPALTVSVSFRVRPLSTGLRPIRNPSGGIRAKARYRNILGRRVSAAKPRL